MATHARFYLLLSDQPSGFDLLAECQLCGAMTERPLALAWEMREFACSNWGVMMRLAAEVLGRLREQAVDALAAIDRLRAL